MKTRFWEFLKVSKNYALITGVIFFVIGLLGFIFKSSSSLPDYYLLLFIVIGFWGILVGLRAK
jgi:hypothetical protein